MADQTPDDDQQDGPANRYSAELLDRLAQEITDGADSDARHDNAAQLTSWAAKRLDPLADEKAIDGLIDARRARRAGKPGDDEIGRMRRDHNARRVVGA